MINTNYHEFKRGHRKSVTIRHCEERPKGATKQSPTRLLRFVPFGDFARNDKKAFFGNR